jgi:hypothetical protein
MKLFAYSLLNKFAIYLLLEGRERFVSTAIRASPTGVATVRIDAHYLPVFLIVSAAITDQGPVVPAASPKLCVGQWGLPA